MDRVTEEVFGRWVSEHSVLLRSIAKRRLGDLQHAEDVVQETFSSAWKSIASFDPSKDERAWLCSILHRRVADYWRKHNPNKQFVGKLHDGSFMPLDPFKDELSHKMRVALDYLPEDMREAFVLVVVGDWTHSEAAKILDVPLGTVLSRVSRARERMHGMLCGK